MQHLLTDYTQNQPQRYKLLGKCQKGKQVGLQVNHPQKLGLFCIVFSYLWELKLQPNKTLLTWNRSSFIWDSGPTLYQIDFLPFINVWFLQIPSLSNGSEGNDWPCFVFRASDQPKAWLIGPCHWALETNMTTQIKMVSWYYLKQVRNARNCS